MATTSGGTTYTVRSTDAVPAAGSIYWAVADNRIGHPDIPIVVYTHGNGGPPNQFSSYGEWKGLRDWLIDNGWAYVECTGGGATSWGNQASRDAYEAALTYVDGQIDTGKVVVLGRSMLGLVAYWLASQSSVIAPRCVGLIINSGTTDLTYRYSVANTTDKANMRTAYGAADDAEFATNSVGFDPMLFPESVWNGRKVLQMWGTADTTVPPANHAQAWIAEYGASCGLLLTDVRDGGDHSAGNGSYLQVDAMANFLLLVVREAAPVPAIKTITDAIYIGADGFPRSIAVTPA
ncbi:minor tail protein [Gordonia phage Mellie]|nr:minor tail protein [Gordonia phage Mellie]